MAPRKPRPDFPLHQLIVLSICRLVEPIAFTSIYPYIYYMVAHFHITSNDGEIAMWTGGAVAAFAFAEMLTGMLWGKLSDRIGRKPVLIGGLTGTGISMLLFGLAPSMPLALTARALGGLLNGNVSVINTTVAELVPKKEHQPRAFSVMPFVWSLGSIIGPSIGGMLAEPVKHYPAYFHEGGLFDKFPYLLPNLACTIICAIGVLNGIFFLDETHPGLIDKPDRGRNIGFKIQDTIAALLGYGTEDGEDLPTASTSNATTETTPLLGSKTKVSEATSNDSSDTSLTLTSSSRSSSVSSLTSVTSNTKPVIKTWTPQVLHNVFAYGIIAFHTIVFDQLISVFLQSSPKDTHLKNLFEFTGGFGLDTQTMGIFFSYQGILSTLFQFLIFAPFVQYFGVLPTFRVIAFMYPFLYFLTPYMAFLPADDESLLYSVIYAVLSLKTICGCLIYPINSILLTNSSPSLLVLGTINGAAGSLASCMRAIAPVLIGWLYSKGVDIGVSGLSWWVTAVVAAVGAVQALYIREDVEDEKVIEGVPKGDLIEVVGEDAVRSMEAGEVVVIKGGKGAAIVSCVEEVEP